MRGVTLKYFVLFPLDRADGLRCEVKQDAVDAVDLMGNAVGDAMEDLVGDLLDGS